MTLANDPSEVLLDAVGIGAHSWVCGRVNRHELFDLGVVENVAIVAHGRVPALERRAKSDGKYFEGYLVA